MMHDDGGSLFFFSSFFRGFCFHWIFLGMVLMIGCGVRLRSAGYRRLLLL